MLDENPILIQDSLEPHSWAYDAGSSPVPLVLLHDGGGTVFSYHCLGRLDRPVYGIANPSYADPARTWPGGLPEMARHHAALVRTVVPPGGSVILGGWSQGGLLGLQVAWELAARHGDAVRVLGVIMVDAVCPLVAPADAVVPRAVVPHAVQWGERTRDDTKEAVMRCFDQAFRLVRQWKLPRWADDPAVQKSEGADGGLGDEEKSIALVREREEGEGQTSKLPQGPPPPVVLLKAKESVPVVQDAENEGGVSRVDLHRHDTVLGWGRYRKDLICKVVEVPGHHFNVFSGQERLDVVTEELKAACAQIELFRD